MITSHTLSECSVDVANIQLLLLFSSKLSSTCDDTAPNMSCTLSRDCDISSLSAPADRSAPAAVYLSIPICSKRLQSVDQTVLDAPWKFHFRTNTIKFMRLLSLQLLLHYIYMYIFILFNPLLHLHRNLCLILSKHLVSDNKSSMLTNAHNFPRVANMDFPHRFRHFLAITHT